MRELQEIEKEAREKAKEIISKFPEKMLAGKVEDLLAVMYLIGHNSATDKYLDKMKSIFSATD